MELIPGEGFGFEWRKTGPGCGCSKFVQIIKLQKHFELGALLVSFFDFLLLGINMLLHFFRQRNILIIFLLLIGAITYLWILLFLHYPLLINAIIISRFLRIWSLFELFIQLLAYDRTWPNCQRLVHYIVTHLKMMESPCLLALNLKDRWVLVFFRLWSFEYKHWLVIGLLWTFVGAFDLDSWWVSFLWFLQKLTFLLNN